MIPIRSYTRRRSKTISIISSLIILTAGCSGGSDRIAMPLHGKSIAVYAAGDIADCSLVTPEFSFAAKTAAVINARLAEDNEAAVLTLGDNVYPNGTPSEFAYCYELTWGGIKPRTYPSPGNHDYETPRADGYFGYFGAMAGPAGRGYYSFNLGSWHVISLNSNLGPEEHKAQLAWLSADLQANPAACTLAYWHHALYSSGDHGNDPRMAAAWAALHEGNADLVLVGHDHHYERFAPLSVNGQRNDRSGIRQFVVGTGGARLSPMRFGRANSEAGSGVTYGVLKLVLRDNGYEWDFLPVAGSEFTDRGSGLCH